MLETAKKELLLWIQERECIRVKKECGKPKPWTNDPVLRDYKFCNVRREDDRVSRWVQREWLAPNEGSPNFAFAACMARHFNWPDTLQLIGFPSGVSFDSQDVKERIKYARDKRGAKIYTGAYTVSTCGRSMDKVDYSIDIVLAPMFRAIRNPKEGETVQDYWKYLQQFEGFSSFMAGQVVADLKMFAPLNTAPDRWSWAPLGPGSIRGLNRMYDRKLTAPLKQEEGLKMLLNIQEIIRTNLSMNMALHNVQNCLCELDKYMRLKYDGGKVRSKYNGRQ